MLIVNFKVSDLSKTSIHKTQLILIGHLKRKRPAQLNELDVCGN